MLDRVAETNNLTIPLADLALSNPCENFNKRVFFGTMPAGGTYGDVACDHLAVAESNIDWQICIQRSGEPPLLKVVIIYCTTLALPRYIAVVSDVKFRGTISDPRSSAQIPKKDTRINIIELKEPYI